MSLLTCACIYFNLFSYFSLHLLRLIFLGYTDFSYAFYMYDILLGISVVTVLWMPVGPKMPVDNIMTDMLKLLRLPHIIAFIFFMFALGNLWGFIESYLFLHLKELGASNYLLGKSCSFLFPKLYNNFITC